MSVMTCSMAFGPLLLLQTWPSTPWSRPAWTAFIRVKAFSERASLQRLAAFGVERGDEDVVDVRLGEVLPGQRVRARLRAEVLDGRELTRIPTRETVRTIGMLPQSAIAPDGLTVRGLVRYGRRPHQGLLRQGSAADAHAVEEALTAADLHSLADRPLETLSGGQRRRAWIAMAVAQETETLLLDEPTSALDMGRALEVLKLVRSLAAQGRTPVLVLVLVLVLHDLTTACRYADHVIALKDGAVVAQGAPAAIVSPDLVRELYGVQSAVLTDPVQAPR